MLRTQETQELYDSRIKSGALLNNCPLCTETPIKEFEHWRVIKNAYPYDSIAAIHDMLVPKRHITETQFNDEEKAELFRLKHEDIGDSYEFMMEGTNRRKTIPSHFHPHLLVIKD